VSLSSDSRIRAVSGAASAATGPGSGMRELKVWLACWFCSAPTEAHGDGSTTPGTCGHSGKLGFADGDGPVSGGEDVPCCVPHAATSTKTITETPASNSLSDRRTG
jgi:hypothetical protein